MRATIANPTSDQTGMKKVDRSHSKRRIRSGALALQTAYRIRYPEMMSAAFAAASSSFSAFATLFFHICIGNICGGATQLSDRLSKSILGKQWPPVRVWKLVLICYVVC